MVIYIYVLSPDGKPLMPTRRWGRVRHLLKEGKAKIVSRNPLTIQLLYETTTYTQPLTLGIDPGSGGIGVAVRKENGEVVFAAELKTRTREVTENMEERRGHRRARRGNQRDKRKRRAAHTGTVFEAKEFAIAQTEKLLVCKGIKPKPIRFQNRKRAEGWLTPTARHLLETHENFINKVTKILPITRVVVEYAQFDLQKLENPEIQGKEYQNGRMKGYANVTEYVLGRDGYACQLCKKSQGLLHVHHVVWRSKRGEDVPENLVTLCIGCHEKVHQEDEVDAQVKELFAGLKKRYVHPTLVNTIMPGFYEWLSKRFTQVDKVYGYQTKERRRELHLVKAHYLDAYLASLDEAGQMSPESKGVVVHHFHQFRRHNRQLIHARRDRNYKEGKKIVAKNRKKRMGQKSDSLAEVLAQKGERYLACLKIARGTKMLRSKKEKYRAGDVVIRESGTARIVKGSNHKGYSVTLVGEEKYLPISQCLLLTKNTGLVWVESTESVIRAQEIVGGGNFS